MTHRCHILYDIMSIIFYRLPVKVLKVYPKIRFRIFKENSAGWARRKRTCIHTEAFI